MASDRLDFISTSDLLSEVANRMDSMVFVASTNRNPDEDSLVYITKGTFHACLGLLEAGKILLLSKDIEDD
jgi:hypothetical protein